MYWISILSPGSSLRTASTATPTGTARGASTGAASSGSLDASPETARTGGSLALGAVVLVPGDGLPFGASVAGDSEVTVRSTWLLVGPSQATPAASAIIRTAINDGDARMTRLRGRARGTQPIGSAIGYRMTNARARSCPSVVTFVPAVRGISRAAVALFRGRIEVSENLWTAS